MFKRAGKGKDKDGAAHQLTTLRTAALAALVVLACTACGGSVAVGITASIGTGTIAIGTGTSTTTTTPVVFTPPPVGGKLPMLHAAGTKWADAGGTQVNLKGVNLGNWLVQEFWMMGQGVNGIDDQCKLQAQLDTRFGYAERDRLMNLFRDNWITTRDWDLMAKFGLNAVRVPFHWSVIEDEKNPRHLRADAWRYLDDALAQAEARGMYVIFDLHGAAGGQGSEQHTGCAGQNLYWTTPDYQERTTWLWEQIATRYKDSSIVAGYSLLNEPWGTTAANLATVVQKLYASVRAIDRNHVIILPGHNSGINAYGNPVDKGMSNVAFEMHFYPGMFGWGTTGLAVHRDWLNCTGNSGTGTLCDWNKRVAALNTPFFIGEFQPWAGMGGELGGQVTRATYDAYANLGWASTSWAYKYVSNGGGQGSGTWGLVTNAAGAAIPKLNFASASKAEIEALFKLFGTAPYEPQQQVMNWMTSKTAPDPFGTGAAR